MNFNIAKRAFSLTELLIVLVIVAVLFAAMAPIATKRFNGSGPTTDSVWKYTDGNQHDAYYDSESPKLSSVAYFGLDPASIKNLPVAEKNQSKTVIKAVNGQDMIQFRYGDGDGLYTGSFNMDNNRNIKSATATSGSLGSYNTIAGAEVFKSQSGSTQNVAVGMRALSGSPGAYHNVAVGVNSAQYLYDPSSGGNNTFVGANTGRSSLKGVLKDNVGLGANVLNSESSSGSRNVLAGFNTASVWFEDRSSDNVILGSIYATKNSQNNTIIGQDAYVGGANTQRNLTALGKGSCSSVKSSALSDEHFSTCIGYYSGAASSGSHGSDTSLSAGGTKDFDTKGEHIYLGGFPNGFGGRSVLEVHNFSSTGSGSSRTATNLGPTVVMNSNLVVRGNTYFINKDGKLSTHSASVVTDRKNGTEKGRDECCTKWFHRRHWHSSSCSPWKGIIGALIGIAATVGGFISMGATTALALAYATLWGGTTGGLIGSTFGGKGYDRARDPLSFSAMNYYFGADSAGKNPGISPTCHAAANENYPDASYKDSASIYYAGSKGACPDLFSDIRLKENISENTDAIEKLLLIMPYNFSYKADKNNTPQVGVIAQDLEKYLPNSVSTDGKGFLQIRNDEIFYVTINSIKALNSKLTALAEDVTSLEGDTTKLSKSHKSIQKRIDSLNKRADELDK
ncbi:MAG: tail fiber domain-containing protein [Muribaculaceae bacterium]|nr:tail fiber domain-containing protein [Muribaculaceae bacterium]